MGKKKQKHWAKKKRVIETGKVKVTKKKNTGWDKYARKKEGK